MRIIRNFDVGSYYPHLMTINGYTSRNIPDPHIYEEMLERRMKAKREGDKVTANALKLVANTTYGGTLNKYNDLYDPLHARSVCISGQLYLLELANHLIADVPDLKIVQLNTDGIMIEFEDTDYDKVLDITDEWQQRTGFTLEEDKIHAIYQKDVNNYVEIAPDGSVKAKGGYLVRGIAPAGAFNINNNAVIVADAIREFFVHGTPAADTINACNDISKFQLIAKAGAKYREAYHIVDGKPQPVQRVNRVYATTDTRYGNLHKIKLADDSEAKIERLPEHCLIDNTALDDPNHTNITQIDKSWYIKQAQDGINRFLGIKPETKKTERKKKMATASAKKEDTPRNVLQRLLDARVRFLDANVKKTGKNMKMAYKYFELDDIVPVALPIFKEVGLLPVTSFNNEFATMTLYNVDDREDSIVFTSPMREIDAIISNKTGGEVTNAIQRLGSVETYQRRYLYMIALDIVEADEMEAMTGMGTDVTPPAAAPKAPVTPVQREEIKQQLTAPDEQADEMMLTALKQAAKKLLTIEGGRERAAKLAVDTKGFTVISKVDCEQMIRSINEEVGANNG